MLERVLDDRLQHEIGDEGAEGLFGNVEVDAEASLEADLHDVDVAAQQRELVAERHFVRRAAVHRLAQQLAEPGDHLPHARGVALDEGGDGVEGVEEEVRIELHPQGVEPRFGQLCLQRGRLARADLIAEEVLAREAGREHRQVRDELIEEAEAADLAERRDRAAVARYLEELRAREREEEEDDHREDGAGADEDGNARRPPRAIGVEAAAEPEDERRRRRPDPRLEIGHGDRSSRCHRPEPDPARIEEAIDDGQRGQRGPEEKDEEELAAAEGEGRH